MWLTFCLSSQRLTITLPWKTTAERKWRKCQDRRVTDDNHTEKVPTLYVSRNNQHVLPFMPLTLYNLSMYSLWIALHLTLAFHASNWDASISSVIGLWWIQINCRLFHVTNRVVSSCIKLWRAELALFCTELHLIPAIAVAVAVAVAAADQYNSSITGTQLEHTQRGNKPKRKPPRCWLSLKCGSILGLCLGIKNLHSCPPL